MVVFLLTILFMFSTKEAKAAEKQSVYFGRYYQKEVSNRSILSYLSKANFVNDRITLEGIDFAIKNGHYYYSTPIEWEVLDSDSDYYLLISKKILDYHTFNDFWHKSDIRLWLNEDFFNIAFSIQEKQSLLKIVQTTQYHPYEDAYIDKKDPQYIETVDYITLLDENEVQKIDYGYEPGSEESESRVAYCSAYANVEEKAGTWWLRGPAIWNYGNLQEQLISARGDCTNWYGTYSYGVRPVIKVKKKAVSTTIAPDILESFKPSADTDSSSSDTSFEDGADFKIGGAKSGKADGDALKFFPGDWSLSLSTFPVKISKTFGKNGSYTIKIAVGVGKSDILKSDATWNKYKTTVENVEKYTKRIGFLESYREKYGLKTATAFSSSAFKKKPELSVMGYLEQTYDKNGKQVASTGKLAVESKWSASASCMFATPIGPFYLNLSGGGGITGSLGPKYDYKKKEWEADGSLVLTPSVTLEGGYGVEKVATIGAQGTASVPIQAVPFSKASFEASAGVHLYIAFVIEKNWTLASCKKTLWDTINKKSLFTDPYTYFRSQEKGTMELLDTSFTKDTTSWNGGEGDAKKSRYLAKGADRNPDKLVLQEGILPSSLPMMKEIGDKKVMIFQSFHPERQAENGTVLKYSVCSGGIWSEPKMLLNDGRADQYADMKVVNDKLVVVWQKQKEKLTVNNTESEESIRALLEEMGKNSEIYYAEFDPATDTFINIKAVTDNQSADMMPQICDNTDDVVIAWVRNDKNDLMQEKENAQNTIITQKLENGIFQNECTICQTEKGISSYVVYEDEGEICAAYIGNNREVYDQTGKMISNDEQNTVTSLRYTEGKLSYIINGSLYQYDPSNGKIETFQAGTSSFGASVQYCTKGDRQTVLWSDYDKKGDVGRIVISIKTETGYSDPIILYEGKGELLRYISPIFTKDGKWQFLSNIKNMETGTNSLVFMEKESVTRLEFSGAEVDENDVDADGLTAVDYYVTNMEDTVVDTIVVSAQLEDGTIIKKEIEKTVQPGESVAGTAYLDFRNVVKKESVQVSVYARNQKDISQNTSVSIIGIPEVQVKGNVKESNSQISIQAELKNNSQREAEVTTYLSQNTKILKSSSAIFLKAGEIKNITLILSKNAIQYREGAAYLKLEARVEEGDYRSDNNVDYVILYQTTKDNKNIGGEKKTTPVKETPKKKNISVPNRVKALKVKNKKKKTVVMTWRKVSGAKGYQIQYAPNKKFTKKKSKYTKKRKYTVKKLKRKKIWYFRVRAYKMNKKKKVYGKWSKTKKVKIRK